MIESNEAFETEEIAVRLAATDDQRLDYLRRRLALLRIPPSPRPRLMDIGCSAGRFMGLAAAGGWEPTGIEMSQSLTVQARRHLPDINVLAGDIMQMDLTGLPPFNAVVALDVIEHVLDPDDFLRRLHGLLVPGGQILLHTPNARSLRARVQRGGWNMLIPEYHFHLFSRKGLGLALQRAGFKIDKMVTASGSGTETGAGAVMARTKERLLSIGALGNALLVTASRR